MKRVLAGFLCLILWAAGVSGLAAPAQTESHVFHYGNGFSWGMTQQETLNALLEGGDRDRLVVYDATMDFEAAIPQAYRQSAWALGVEGLQLDGPANETVVMDCIGTEETGLYTILYYLFWLEDATQELPFSRAQEICTCLEKQYGTPFSEVSDTPAGDGAEGTSLKHWSALHPDGAVIEVSVETDGTYDFIMIVFANPESPVDKEYTETADTADRAALADEDFTYKLLPDGSAEIIRYNGSASQLTIPETLAGVPVSRLGDEAFAYTNSLRSVVIPEGVTALGSRVFCMSHLSEITLPDSLTEIGANPFQACDMLSRITVSPDHPFLEVKDGALFSKPDRRLVCCFSSGASQYTVPEGTEVIGDAAFAFHRALESVTLPDGLLRIGNEAFDNCVGLTEIILPDTVKSIGDYAFSYCFPLTAFTIPESVTELGSYVFNECAGLGRVTLPDSLSAIGNNPFVACASLTEIAVSPDHPALAVTDGVLFSKPDRRLVCALPALSAEHFDIPDGTRTVGAHAFYGCGCLVSVTIPDSVTAFGIGAFADCTGLTEVKLPAGITEISDFLFAGCESLSAFSIPDGVTRIGDQAFLSCALTEMVIPDSVTCIYTEAFLSCSALRSVTLPDSLRSLGDRAFCWCSSLSSVTIPDSVTEVGVNPFCHCDSLTEIAVSVDHPFLEIRDGVLFTRPDRKLVCYPFALTAESCTVPEGTEAIGDYAFYECASLKTVILPDSLKKIGGAAFLECVSLAEIRLPDSVTEIDPGAFSGCDQLVLVVTPRSAAERYCFENRLSYRTAE